MKRGSLHTFTCRNIVATATCLLVCGPAPTDRNDPSSAPGIPWAHGEGSLRRSVPFSLSPSGLCPRPECRRQWGAEGRVPPPTTLVPGWKDHQRGMNESMLRVWGMCANVSSPLYYVTAVRFAVQVKGKTSSAVGIDNLYVRISSERWKAPNNHLRHQKCTTL